MKQFQRGQRSKLAALTPSTTLEVGIAIASKTSTTFDVSCFGVDENNFLSDDRYLVFYNQKKSPEGEIEALGPRNGDAETFRIDLDQLPPTVRKLAFTVTVDLESEGTMAGISQGQLRLLADGAEVVRYPFEGTDFGGERSLILAEIYHKDVWRFAAVGQGFEGDLRALLKHFGGEEKEEPAPVTPGPTLRVEERGALQRTIEAASPGATLRLGPDEYEGPIRIDKPLTIEGEGAAVWARRGPVLTVASAGVVLRNLSLEVTMLDSAEEAAAAEADVALKVAGGGHEPRLEGVNVRGRVVGLGGEDGAWRLPLALDLGAFAPRVENRFVVGLGVPAHCRLACDISGLGVEPEALPPGVHDVTLTLGDIPAETLISGAIEVRSPNVTRTIAVSGGTVGAGNVPASNTRLWG